jgi:hypothetical protein
MADFMREGHDFQQDMDRLMETAMRIEWASKIVEAGHLQAGVVDKNRPRQLPSIMSKLRSHSLSDAEARYSREAEDIWFSLLARSALDNISYVIKQISPHSVRDSLPSSARFAALQLLSELTPVSATITSLARMDFDKAIGELSGQMDVIGKQFAKSLALLETVNRRLSIGEAETSAFNVLADETLKNAGGGYSLTSAAKKLGVSRQALHKRIQSGTALGMMKANEIVVPSLQFKKDGGAVRIVTGLAPALRVFRAAKAGEWAFLQFLDEIDPNLDIRPIDALKEGKIKEVEHAARAHLGLGEG